MTWMSRAMTVVAAILAFSSSGCHGAAETRTITSPSAVAHGRAHQALPARASYRFNDCVEAGGDNAVSIQQCLEDELAYQQRALVDIQKTIMSRKTGTERDAFAADQQAWQAASTTSCGQLAASSERPEWLACRIDAIVGRSNALSRIAAGANVGASFADVRPDERGAFDIRSGDFAMTLRSDGCTGKSWLHCSGARLKLNTPSIAGQVIELRQLVFAGEAASGALCRDSLRSGLDYACSIILTDVNGDRHEDLMVWTGHEGTYGDPSYSYFLYDSDAGRLVEDRELAEMVLGHSLSRIVDGRLEVWFRSGPCDRGEKTIDARGASPKIAEQTDYNGCKQPPR